ncbi:hypothetical protein SL003B_p0063 (plasmid) [Polymorphum gilvum SL003B-26A1]|uniref:Uncharacterized protein n=1 Tax=Polymorphum gilvum (strain LMG 25793 / CGMCC 1.9160 / SL003B-26A1) TaxID=991905 RepID=F2J700_POLGS|nr:hypothetical protein SL003B_p0063 [Polymorphum gilvum SL003B-26A1]EGP54031.1 hypothetical protein Agau_P200209 [Agrobacterium tumefaciens F2]
MRNLRPERADPARWLLEGPGTVAITAKAKPSGGSLLADPQRVDRRRSGPGPGRHRIKSGVGLLRRARRFFRHRSFTGSAATATTRRSFHPAPCRCLAVTGAFLISNRLDGLDRTFALLQQTIGRSGD